MLGVLETKRIIPTRKAPKKQHLTATGASPEKEMASTEAAASENSLFSFKKLAIISATKTKKGFQVQPKICHQRDESKRSHIDMAWVPAAPGRANRRDI